MSNEAKLSMMLCSKLTQEEQERVERLDNTISEKFHNAGLVVRLCEGSGSGENRILNFIGPDGVMGTILAPDFLSAPDEQAVEMIELRRM